MLALPLLLSLAQAAPPTAPLETGDRRVLAAASFEPHAVGTLGYAHGLSLGARPLGLSASLSLPLVLLDGRHHRIALSAQTPLLGEGPWQLHGRAGAFEQSTSGALLRGTALGVQGGLLGGRFGARGFVALQAEARWSPAARLAPSETYSQDLAVDMPTGWYASPAAYGNLGLQGGWAFRERVELTGRFAMDASLGGGRRLAPMEAGLGLNLWL